MAVPGDNQNREAIAAHSDQSSAAPPTVLSNAEIADRLASLAQLLSSQKENPYKVKAYQRAAARIRDMSESLDEMVRDPPLLSLAVDQNKVYSAEEAGLS